MMRHLLLLLIAATITHAYTFISITDNHYDTTYTIGSDPATECRSGVGNAGVYGYADKTSHCQTPLLVLESACESVNDLYPNPDAILLTGDFQRSGNFFHNVTRDTYIKSMQQMTDTFAKSFPQAVVLPVLGNHDEDPTRPYLEPGPQWALTELGKMWGTGAGGVGWLPDDAVETFELGGYYHVDPVTLPGLRFVILNTCLYVDSNTLTDNVTDPAGQFSWFESVLQGSEKQNLSVWLLAHCPPGPEFRPDQNKRYVELLSRYSGVIKGHAVGHIHHGMFMLVQDDFARGNTTVGSIFLNPSITPDNGKGGAHAPVYRAFDVSKSTYDPLDYTQVSLNLTNANKGLVKWEPEYSAASAYDLPDLTPSSMRMLWHLLDSNETAFSDFWGRFWGGWQPADEHSKCDEVLCRHGLLLVMRYLLPPLPLPIREWFGELFDLV